MHGRYNSNTSIILYALNAEIVAIPHTATYNTSKSSTASNANRNGMEREREREKVQPKTHANTVHNTERCKLILYKKSMLRRSVTLSGFGRARIKFLTGKNTVICVQRDENFNMLLFFRSPFAPPFFLSLFSKSNNENVRYVMRKDDN